ncbi:MAG: hypothetical protein IKA87_10565 [Lentisphaeria bacterium]|nr:hypothetical protein [Lentisphaeria bacterium]
MYCQENVKVAEILPVLNKYLHPEDDLVMFKALLSVILERKPGMSYLQRTLEISFNRAAELLEIMENRGVVSPPSAVGCRRSVLVLTETENTCRQE